MNINTTLTNYTNVIDDTAQEIIRLLKLYIPEFVEVYYGYRPFGTPAFGTIVAPCAMVEPITSEPIIATTDMTHDKIDFKIYAFIQQQGSDEIVRKSTEMATLLKKIFSNNALNDVSVIGGHTGKYKTNEPIWYDSDIGQVFISPTYLATDSNSNILERHIVMPLSVKKYFLS